MPLDKYSRQIRLVIHRVGIESTVLRESTSTTSNGYGKEDGRWDTPQEVGTWKAFRSYGYRSDRPEQIYTGAGERDEDTPLFILPDSADIQDGDRIVYNGIQYEVTSKPVNYGTHYECRTTRVKDYGSQ